MVKDDLSKGKITEAQAQARLTALNKRTDSATVGISERGTQIQQGIDKAIDGTKEVGKFAAATACTAATAGVGAAACRVGSAAAFDTFVEGVKARRDGKEFNVIKSAAGNVVSNVGAAAPVKLPAGTGALGQLTQQEAKKYLFDGAKKVIGKFIAKEVAKKYSKDAIAEVKDQVTKKIDVEAQQQKQNINSIPPRYIRRYHGRSGTIAPDNSILNNNKPRNSIVIGRKPTAPALVAAKKTATGNNGNNSNKPKAGSYNRRGAARNMSDDEIEMLADLVATALME